MKLNVDAVSYAYSGGAAALRAVTLQSEKPELLTIIGPNGSGKSTLLKVIARILRPQRGVVQLDGRNHLDWSPREYARRVGYLPQELELPFRMRAIDVVLSGRAPYLGRFRWEDEADLEVAVAALRASDAEQLRDRYLDEMSGGEKKRVFLARVLAGEPGMILLDEPLASLDIGHVRSLAAVMRQQVADGKSVIFVAHDFNWAAAVSDRVAVMHRGELVACGPPRQVLEPQLLRDVFEIEAEIVESSDGVGWIVPSLKGP
jgi:iron complex transport system ATP-binding protein